MLIQIVAQILPSFFPHLLFPLCNCRSYVRSHTLYSTFTHDLRQIKAIRAVSPFSLRHSKTSIINRIPWEIRRHAKDATLPKFVWSKHDYGFIRLNSTGTRTHTHTQKGKLQKRSNQGSNMSGARVIGGRSVGPHRAPVSALNCRKS